MFLSYPVYRAVRVAAAAALALSLPALAGAQSTVRVRDTRMTMLRQWVAAIDVHVPGELDAPLVQAAKLTPAQRGLLLELATIFATYTRDLALPPATLRHLKADEMLAIELLGKQTIAAQSYAAWLHRAVMFETDVAILAPDLTAAAMQGAHLAGAVDAIHTDDGELGDRESLNWHWAFARDLVDVREPSASDSFAASWYHAVALHQLDRGLLAEMPLHLDRALKLFPSDARLEFDRACLADSFSSARVQAVLIGDRPGTFRPNVPTKLNAEIEAANHFTQALVFDPTMDEARVRLARLKANHGEAGPALALLTRALAGTLPDETEYMAHLIAARANATLSQTEAAAEHLRMAIKMYPTAQTPLIAMSHLALEAGAIDDASTLASSLGAKPDGGRNDPWWAYFQASWLNAGALLDTLRVGVRK